MSDNNGDVFEVHLAKRNITLKVQPEQSILQVLQDAGLDVPHSCSEGVCGTCLTRVVEGEPDHWDMYLTSEEQEKGDCIMVCVSRSKSPRLVLDLEPGMTEAFEILGITGPIYLAIAIGYLVTQRGWFSRADMQVLGKFTIQLALPALLFNALSRRSVAEILNWEYLLAYALATLAVVLAGLFWTRRIQGKALSLSAVLTMGMACPNSGFVGYPIMLLTLGSTVAGVSLALNMVVENLLIIPLMLAVAASEGAPGQWRQAFVQTLKGLLGNPMIWGIVSGFLVSLTGLYIPEPISRTINLFAAASGALSLFVIGGALVGLKPEGVKATLAQVALGKLVLHPLAMAVVLLWLIPVTDPALRTAGLLTCALPMMGIYTILSQRLGHGAISAAALLVTTVLSFFSLSGLLWLLRLYPI